MARAIRRKTLATEMVPSLGVSDIDRSVAFYRQFFGFHIVDSYEMEGRMAWCWMRVGSANLMLQQLSAEQQITLDPAIGQSWMLYVRPNDLNVLHSRLSQAGFPVTEIAQTSYGASEFFVSDPDGYELWISVPAAHGDDEEEEEEEPGQSEDDEDYDDEDDDEDEEEEWRVRH